MASYPNSIASLINPGADQYLKSPSHSGIESNQNNEIVAIETELGLGLKGSVTDLVTRLGIAINNDGSLKTQQLPLSYLDIDGTLANNSDIKVPSQKAIKSYVDTGLGTKQDTLTFTPEEQANKSTDITLGGLTPSDVLYPTEKAAKTYSDTKEPAISAGTTSEYFRGDKTFVTLDTSAVPEATNLYYTDARVKTKVEVDESYSISGPWTFNRVVVGQTPTGSTHLVTKGYVDNVVSNIAWKAPVATFADLATTYPTPSTGWAAYVIDVNLAYVWNGSAWVVFSGGVADHNSLTGLQGGVATEYYHLTNAEHTVAIATRYYYLVHTFILAAGVSATIGTNKTNQIIIPGAGVITKAYISAKTGPTGQALIVDINKNGTTIWSTQANRVQIAAAATYGTQTSFNTTALAEDDLLTIDVDQVGSGVPAQDITVALKVKYTVI